MEEKADGYLSSLSLFIEYDAAGNPTRSYCTAGPFAHEAYFAYDALNRLNKKRFRNESTYYAYDGVSNLTKLQYPRGTAACYYVYDADNRMSTATTVNSTRCYFEYDASSNIARKRLGNGVSAYYSYDKAERVSGINYIKPVALLTQRVLQLQYRRDLAGRINRIALERDLLPGVPDATYAKAIYYSYDSVDRLTNETWLKATPLSQIYAFSYSYDAAGNRLKMRREKAGVEFENAYYTYNAANALAKRRNLLPSALTTYYNYDPNGALTKMWDGTDSTYFEYYGNQFIKKITPPAGEGNPWTFYYDGQLNRWRIDKGTSTYVYYAWDGTNLLDMHDTAGNSARFAHGYTPIPGIGSTIEAQQNTPTTTYYQYPIMDHRGTVYAMLDPSRNTLLEYTQDAFGRQLSAIGGAQATAPNELIYQTNWLTVKIGAKYWGHSPSRIYDFDTGQFTQRDPLSNSIILSRTTTGNTLGIFSRTKFARLIIRATFYNRWWLLHAYAYARNNATSIIDVTGLLDCKNNIVPKDVGVASGDVGETDPRSIGPKGSTLNDVISKIKEQIDPKCDCIKTLAISAHSNELGMALRGVKAGDPGAKLDIYDPARWDKVPRDTSSDLDKANDLTINNAKAFVQGLKNKVCLCTPCEIYLLGCSIGLGQLDRILAKETNCTVWAPRGGCRPNLDKPMESEVFHDEHEGHGDSEATWSVSQAGTGISTIVKYSPPPRWWMPGPDWSWTQYWHP